MNRFPKWAGGCLFFLSRGITISWFFKGEPTGKPRGHVSRGSFPILSRDPFF